jgi:hypothetical protein
MISKNDQKIIKQRVRELVEGKLKFQSFLNRYYEKFEFLQRNENICVSAEDTVKFAESITPITHAPPGWKPGFPLFNGHAPTPLFEEMRAGHLEKYNLRQESNNPNNVLKRKFDDSNEMN